MLGRFLLPPRFQAGHGKVRLSSFKPPSVSVLLEAFPGPLQIIPRLQKPSLAVHNLADIAVDLADTVCLHRALAHCYPFHVILKRFIIPVLYPVDITDIIKAGGDACRILSPSVFELAEYHKRFLKDILRHPVFLPLDMVPS